MRNFDAGQGEHLLQRTTGRMVDSDSEEKQRYTCFPRLAEYRLSVICSCVGTPHESAALDWVAAMMLMLMVVIVAPGRAPAIWRGCWPWASRRRRVCQSVAR